MNKKDIRIGERQSKVFSLGKLEVKEEERDGVKLGIIEGYGATFDLDRGDDIILKGSFLKSLERHKADNRPIRMLFGHDRNNLIGGFPVSEAREDEKGLWVKGEINLDTQQGQEAFALAKQGVLTDMSIGFSITSRDAVSFEEIDDRIIRVIKEIELWEISLVSEPMNAAAKITTVKGVEGVKELPIAARDAEWDEKAALERISELENPTDAFLLVSINEKNEAEVDMQIADVIDGKLQIIPKAVFAASMQVLGVKSYEIPEGKREALASTLAGYYSKMGMESPFERSIIDVTFAEACDSIKDVESLLKFAGFSSDCRKALISTIKSSTNREGELETDTSREGEGQKEVDDLVDMLKGFNTDSTTKLLLSQF